MARAHERTVAQAEKLDQLLSEAGTTLDGVYEFRVDDDQLVERISGRRIHPASGRSYHVKTKPPKVDGVDDVTGEALVQRADDNEETLRKRLSAYHEHTEPVIKYYDAKGLLKTFDAQRPPADIYVDLKAALQGDNKSPDAQSTETAKTVEAGEQTPDNAASADNNAKASAEADNSATTAVEAVPDSPKTKAAPPQTEESPEATPS